ncbi:DUF3954 domain-containing protein [Radiobacillus kanasensis]|uniref:DUF3954 domain-containing protein n=1 Tax=Radiobacillus kanasensis TaxID=2844358 RepID=UPI001E61F69E|nr:DUF3954 domain-containing protein [Radiobacillus kanasensis]UFU00352.1 DUF3954 domain-containing protein [Radiobacillus kanasensis]
MVKMDFEKMSAEISLKEDALFVVKNGQLTKVTAKPHGQDLIIWKNGQVLDIDRSERVRITGQEFI